MPNTHLTIKAAVTARQQKAPTVVRAPLTAEQKRKKQEDRQQRQAEIDAACAQFFSEAAAKASELSEKFGKTQRYFLDLFFQGGAKMISERNKGNSWNAFVSQKANKENEDMSHPVPLKEIQQMHKDEYDALTAKEKDLLAAEHQAEKNMAKTTPRVTARGRAQDVANVVRNMTMLLSGLNARVGIEAFFCIVRTSASFHMMPQWYFTNAEVEKFLTVAVRKRWDTSEVGAKLEAFAIAGSDMMSMLKTSKARADFLKGQIRDGINDMLVKITKNSKAIMQYVNYERDIVIKYGIVLEGWTHPVWANPSDLSTSLPPLQTLASAIKSGACRFVALPAEERRQRELEYHKKRASGEMAEQPRKTRKDKGTKHKRSADMAANDSGPEIVTRRRYQYKRVNGKKVIVIDTELPDSSDESDSDSSNPSSSLKRRRTNSGSDDEDSGSDEE